MRKIILPSALCFALAAPFFLPAQSRVPAAPLTQTASLQPFPSTWATITAPILASPSAESIPNAPTPMGEFAAILSIPCITRITPTGSPAPGSTDMADQPCLQDHNPYTRFLDTAAPTPLTRGQKARLAFHDLKDPGNLVTIADLAAFTIATNAHTAYGAGWRGFARDAGYSFTQDATGEFVGTFMIPSLLHQDPRYHRMPNASVPRRILHALSHTLVSQSDTGRTMPNFATLLTYPISAEISNQYVPGIHGNGPSTVARICTGFATDPADNLITEFLPDVARHIHIRVVFVQSILNQVSSDQYSFSGH